MQPPENIFSAFFSMLILTYHFRQIEYINFCNLDLYKNVLKKAIFPLFFIVKLIYLNLIGLLFLAFVFHNESLIKFFRPSTSEKRIHDLANSLAIPETNQKSIKSFLSEFLINKLKNEGVITVGKNNMYNFYLNGLIMPNQMLYWHYGVTFNDSISDIDYFKPEKVFNNIKYIEFDFCGDHARSCHKFMMLYGRYIETNFKLVYSQNGIKTYARM